MIIHNFQHFCKSTESMEGVKGDGTLFKMLILFVGRKGRSRVTAEA